MPCCGGGSCEPGGHDQPRLAHPVGLELLDHHAVEERAQVVAGHRCKSLTRSPAVPARTARCVTGRVRGYVFASWPALRNARDRVRRGFATWPSARASASAPSRACSTTRPAWPRPPACACAPSWTSSATAPARPRATCRSGAPRRSASSPRSSPARRSSSACAASTTSSGASAYDLTLFNIETRDQRRAALRRFARRDRVDGVIVISLPLTPAEVRALHRDGVPTVLVDVAHALLPNVAIDDVAGGAMAARHLLEAGHRHVAFVGDVEDNPFAFASSQRRLEGIAPRAAARPASRCRRSYVRRGPFGRETAVELTRAAARAAPRADRHLRGLRRAGLRRARRGRARGPRRARRPLGHRLRRHRARGGHRPDHRAPAAARVRARRARSCCWQALDGDEASAPAAPPAAAAARSGGAPHGFATTDVIRRTMP